MIKYDKHTSKKTGITKTQVRVTTEVLQPNGNYSKITVKNFGYLEDQENQEEFKERIKRFDEEYKSGKSIIAELRNLSCFDVSNSSYNFGYRYLESIYDFLEIDSFLDSQKTKVTYDLKEVFKYDVLMRILCPGSKRATIQLRDCLYDGNYSFRLHQNYRSLTYYAKWKDDLLRHLNQMVKNKIGRNSEYALYDCTNYYFEHDKPYGLFQRGVSKEHRTEPIVQLGLFLDTNSLPITFSLFKGNTSDSYTLSPVMREVHSNYGLKRLIVVGDKGFNTKDNITFVLNDNNGFVFSNKLRGKGKATPKYQYKCFDTSTWIGDDKFKYTIFEDEIESKGLINSEKKAKIKVLIYYKKEIANLEKARRNEKIEKAKEYLKNNPGIIKMASDKATKQYLKSTHYSGKDGEVADKQLIELNQEKIDEEEKLDGFFCLITSELEYDYEKIMSTYSQLWMIEESFRITKSDLEARPAFVWTDEHITGFFVETFVALLIVRLLQYKMGIDRISVQRIIEVLNSCNCNKFTDDVIHIERIGGRNAFLYKKYKDNEKPQSTLQLITDVIEDGSILTDDIGKEKVDQIQNDARLIFKTFNISEPSMWMRKKHFEKYLENINFSTIMPKINRKPGRPRKQ